MSASREDPAILCVDKPAGATSHDVVQWVRWALRVKSVGHFGTLDPGATGLLVLGVGAATRLGPWMTGLDKRYRAAVTLGRATTTADADGETTERASCEHLVLEAVERAAMGLVGQWSLPPPVVSAIHVDGRRAHERARAGEDVVVPPRAMQVHAVDDLRVDLAAPAQIELEVHVSKGTYVRSLAVELGHRLGVPAHLHALRRLTVGALRVDDAGTVGGLAVDGAPPRARVGFADLDPEDPARRDLSGARLRAALHPAWHGLPVPVHAVADSRPGRDLWRDLGHGRRPPLSPEALQGGGRPEPGVLAIRGAAAALVICELDDAGTLHPRRRVAPADA